jgi:hypothetical protein
MIARTLAVLKICLYNLSLKPRELDRESGDKDI